MVGGARRKSCGCGIASGPRVRRVRACGGRKGDSGGTGKVGGGGSKVLHARGVQIEGRQIRIEGEGGCILVVPDSEDEGSDIFVVPDSEDEGPDMEMANMAAEGKAAVMVPATPAPAVAVAAGMGPDAALAVGGAPGIEVAVDGAPGMELAPEVQERLKVVLAGIDPVYHDIFISLIKVMVPAFFKSN